MVAALLTLEERTRFSILLAFSLLLVARRICQKIGDLIGFYLKVDMSKVPGYTGPAYPLYLLMLTVLTTSF
jgi:hypothetical protein